MLRLEDPWASEDALHGRTVLVAMSGGVDSSVAAVLLQRRGARVLGLTMKNFCYSEAETTERSCCSVSHMLDARGVCDQLGIPHFVLDTTADFGRRVMDRFVAEYEAGRTPNPCVDCNQSVRFPQLVAKARELGADLVATGHYARLGRDADGRSYVRRPRDAAKDQSYFLSGVSEPCLARSVFPLGELTKAEVRMLGREIGLEVAEKPESQEICFLPDGDRARFLAERAAPRPGPVVDANGAVLGAHSGIGNFTVGQRRHLGVDTAGRVRYVRQIQTETNTVVLGDEAELYASGLEADGFWIGVETGRDDLLVQVRYRHPPVGLAALEVAAGLARMRFASPVRAVAPGQAAVLYCGDAVVGGGRILATIP